jgi:hypothetical protein
MAEQTFRSPGFFEQEIDLTAQVQAPIGIPAGVVGTSEKGPAFVPVTVGSITDFQAKFGGFNSNRFGPYAVNEWLKNQTAATYIRVLGAGANTTATDISTTQNQGTVLNAGFKVSGSVAAAANIAGTAGDIQLIVARHDAVANEANAYPQFSDNSSCNDANNINLVRGIIMTTTGSRVLVIDNNGFYSGLATSAKVNQGNVAKVGSLAGTSLSQTKYFKLVISSTLSTFGTTEGYSSIRILTASLDPSDPAYISRVLNTDPLKFGQEQHLLYADFAVEHDLAPVLNAAYPTVAIMSGSLLGSADSGAGTSTRFLELFGRFDTRYTTARTTSFISQPYGRREYDLFHFETIDDGAVGNDSFKISIANLRASTDPAYPYGTFEVQVRNLKDTDTNPQILEAYPNCTLDPQSDRYIAKVIGDKKVYFNFDAQIPSDRKLVITGKYPNISSRVRVIVNSDVESGVVPSDALPFGFRGIPALKTTDSLTDVSSSALVSKSGRILGDTSYRRLEITSGTLDMGNLKSSIVPPIPYRIKATRGPTSTSGFLGYPGTKEIADARYYWGVVTTKIPVSSSTDPASKISNSVLIPNEGSEFNQAISSHSKFVGIEKLDVLVTGSAVDEFNDNKFTLARVATSQTGTGLAGIFSSSVFSGSADQIMLETAYIRNASPSTLDYTVTDGVLSNRYTLASLVATSSILFNRFTPYAKFTNIFYGGFDGLDITDRDRYYFRDKAFSGDAGGKASTGYSGPLNFSAGTARLNNNVASVNAAVGIMTDPFSTNVNLLAIPGVRDAFVTNNALSLAQSNGSIMYVMDLLKYDGNGNRLYDDSAAQPDSGLTSEKFESRAIDNNYGATFFPDVNITDSSNNTVVKVPASVAALGVLGFNDKNAAPWFAPAGFNRGALGFVTNVEVRLTQSDRDTLYDARINPIASFPTGGFVIFGQKTLQQARSALDRINVRRLLLELKRGIGNTAQSLIFEPNNAQTRNRLVAGIVPQLALVQSRQGIESFQVICDDTNNTAADVEANRLNCRIVIVPTRTIEFISIDFILTNAGVQFL